MGHKKKGCTLILPDCAAGAPPFPLLFPFSHSSITSISQIFFRNHAYFHLPFQSPVGHERENLISIASLRNKKEKKRFPFPDRFRIVLPFLYT